MIGDWGGDVGESFEANFGALGESGGGDLGRRMDFSSFCKSGGFMGVTSSSLCGKWVRFAEWILEGGFGGASCEADICSWEGCDLCEDCRDCPFAVLSCLESCCRGEICCWLSCSDWCLGEIGIWERSCSVSFLLAASSSRWRLMRKFTSACNLDSRLVIMFCSLCTSSVSSFSTSDVRVKLLDS